MMPNKPLNLNLNVYFSLCVWGKVFCLRFPRAHSYPESFSQSVCRSVCRAVMACQDLFWVFHGPLKCAVSATVAAIRWPRPFRTASATLASGGGPTCCPGSDLSNGPTRRCTWHRQPTLIRQNIDKTICGVTIDWCTGIVCALSFSLFLFNRSVSYARDFG